ncbi:MAG: nuclear transport factor 2 family protein [Candidatus Bathyarchaeota archaeon]|nr:nuclear transport factor 2 family protein [Candidatus Bathyarchaeota archaeon]
MELQGIREAVDAYLQAIKTGDYKFFKRAFYPDAVVIYAGEKDLNKKATPIKVFADMVKERHESGTDSEEIPLGITTSYVGGVANVRLDFELKIGEKTLYGADYLNLVKHNDQWKISQKIYDVTRTEG